MTVDLAETLRWLVDIPSVIGREEEICSEIHGRLSASYAQDEMIRIGNGLVVGRRQGRPLVLLVGHIDTVPHQGQPAAFVEAGRLVGLGASDMKSGVAVMLHLLEDVDVIDGPYDVVGVFYDREEGPVEENQLRTILEAVPWLTGAEFGVVLEPTDLRLELGCNGAMNITVGFVGKSAHSARPWLGENAITKAAPLLTRFAQREPQPVTQGGLEFLEVMTVTLARGGLARNVVPAEFNVNVSYRFPPTLTLDEAEARFREFAADADSLEFVDRAPAAPVPMNNPHMDRLAGVTGAEQAPKQGWTDVARLAEYGIPAVNYGPGEVAFAHQVAESVDLANLPVAFGHLKTFLTS
ncbi:MAG: succinyl-diaminopimelate desuccinylase [Acidimicrobiia bacterium]|nr:succinyl-diaminopimelate desuccinylase [Acidimicrobiia bacterium]